MLIPNKLKLVIIRPKNAVFRLPEDLRAKTCPHGNCIQQAKTIVKQVTGKEHANKGGTTGKGEGAVDDEEEECDVLKKPVKTLKEINIEKLHHL